MATPEDPGQQPVAPVTTMVEHVAIPTVVGGLTVRQYFAAASLAGIRAAGHEMDAQMAARMAFVDADAMLAEGVQP